MRLGAGTDHDCGIIFIIDDEIVDGKLRRKDEYHAYCSCSAKWTHPKNTTMEKIQSIYESHVAYSKHEPMKVL